jgi:hypothetical protein
MGTLRLNCGNYQKHGINIRGLYIFVPKNENGTFKGKLTRVLKKNSTLER